MIDQRLHSIDGITPSSSPSSRPLRLPPPPAPPLRPTSMLAFENPQSRPLSPITELTTPGSFRTIALPLVEPLHPDDYDSEHEQGVGEDDDDASTYSRDSGDTVIYQPNPHEPSLSPSSIPPGDNTPSRQDEIPGPLVLGAPIQTESLSKGQAQIPFPTAQTRPDLQPTKSIKRIPPPPIHPVENQPTDFAPAPTNPTTISNNTLPISTRGEPQPISTPNDYRTNSLPIDVRPTRFERPASFIVAGATSPFDIANAEIRRRANERARPVTLHGSSPSMTPLSGSLVNLTELRESATGTPPRMVPDEGYGIAGVGAGGRSRPNSIRSRPSSFHAQRPDLTSPSLAELAAEESINNSLPSLTISPRPAFISQHSHPTLHNIPMLPFDPSPEPSPKKGKSTLPTKTPPRSRPSSLLKRPNSYHGSRPGSMKSRPSSVHVVEGTSSGGYDSLEPAAVPISAVGQREDGAEVEIPAPVATPKEQSPPSTLRAHLSDTSLPLPSSPNPKSHRRTPPRRRIVSSIFSTLFGSSTPDLTSPNPQPQTSRRLSKRRTRTSSLGFTSRSPSLKNIPLPSSTEDNDETLSPPSKPSTAIRTSGTFGIPDDGSDLYLIESRLSAVKAEGAEGVRPDIFRARTESGTGSVVSEGVKRVLYVKNGHVDESVFEDEERVERVDDGIVGEGVGGESVVRGHAQGVVKGEGGHTIVQASGGYLLKPAGNDGSVIMVERASLDGVERPFTLSPPATRAPFQVYQTNSRPPTPPLERIQYPASTAPRPEEREHVIVTSPVPLDEPARSEQSHNTLVRSEPSPSPKRPLPRPPSDSRPNSTFNPSSSQSHDSHSNSHFNDTHAISRETPLLHIPPPPSREPSSGFTPRSTPFPNAQSQPHQPDLSLLIASHLLSTQAASMFQHSSHMKDVSETMYKMARESLEWGNQLLGMAREGERWDGMPGLGIRGGEGVPFPSVGPAGMDSTGRYNGVNAGIREMTPKASSVPLKDDNFTPIPERPSSKRTRSISTLNLHSQTPQAGLSDMSHDRSVDSHVVVPNTGVWLSEVERLGREGWNSLHQAEEAWLGAMSNLREIAARQVQANQGRVEQQMRIVSDNSGAGNSALGGSSGTAYSPSQQILNDTPPDKRMTISRHQSLEHLSSMVNYQTAALPDSASVSPHKASGLDKGYSDYHLGFDSLAAIASEGKGRPISRVSAGVGGGGRKLSKKQPGGEVMKGAQGVMMPIRLERVPTREKEGVEGVKGGSMRSGSVKRKWWGGRKGKA